MKKKLARLLGVFASLALVSGLVVGVPTTASGGTQAWSAVTLPSATGIVMGGADVMTMTVGSDGDIYATAVTEAAIGTWGAGAYDVIKSTDGGVSWARTGFTPTGVAVPIAIVVSSQDEDTIYVAESDAAGTINNISKSVDGGTTFTTSYALPAGTGNITSMDVTYFSTAHQIIVGTDLQAASNVQLLDESPALPTWANTGTALWNWVSAVKFSPAFATDRTITAVASLVAAPAGGGAGDTILSQRSGAGAWAASVSNALLGNGSVMVDVAGDADTATDTSDIPVVLVGRTVPYATIVYPDDWSLTNNIVFVGTNGSDAAVVPATDDVYQVFFLAATVVLDRNAGGAGTATSVASLAISGNAAAAKLWVGAQSVNAANAAAVVRYSANSGTTWAAASKQPTGGGGAGSGSTVAVALASDHSTSGTVYAATAGADNTTTGAAIAAATPLDESAFSVATGDTIFNQISLIDTAIFATTGIDSVTPAGTTELYMVTHSLGVATTGTSSLWRTSTLPSGGTWTRIFLQTNAAGAFPHLVFSPSLTYATDNSSWIISDGPVARTSSTSNLGAVYATTVTVPGSAADVNVVAAESLTNAFIGDAGGGLTRTSNQGLTWTVLAAGAGAINTLELAPTYPTVDDILIGGAAGVSGLSANAGVSARLLGATGTLAAAAVWATFDPLYADNSLVYVVSTGANVDRITVATSAATDTAATIAAAGVTAGSGIAAFAGPSTAATLYVSDSTADTSPMRSINPNATTVVTELLGSNTAGAALAGAAQTLTRIVGTGSTTDGNTLWAINSAAAGVQTFTDTLNVVAGTGTSVATGATTASVSWDAVTNAASYVVAVTAPTGAGAATITYPTTATTASAVVSTLTTGAAYTFTVRVNTNDRSYTSAAADLTTQPGPPPWNPGVNTAGAIAVVPELGSNEIVTTPSLQWNTSAGATGFEIVVGTSAADADSDGRIDTADVVDATLAGGNSTVYTITDALGYGTTYYWQVRASLGASFSPWTGIYAFTVGAEPVVPEPAATITATVTAVTTPTLTVTTVTQPQATVILTTTQTTTQVTTTQAPATTLTVTQAAAPNVTLTVPPATAPATPSYVWVVIAIGGVLLLVVIILIVRTRRV